MADLGDDFETVDDDFEVVGDDFEVIDEPASATGGAVIEPGNDEQGPPISAHDTQALQLPLGQRVKFALGKLQKKEPLSGLEVDTVKQYLSQREQKVPALEAANVLGANSAAFEFGDEGLGLARAAMKKLQGGRAKFSDLYQDERDAIRAYLNKAHTDNPIVGTASKLLGGAATGVITPAGRAANLVQGAITGAGMSEGKGALGIAGDAAKGAAFAELGRMGFEVGGAIGKEVLGGMARYGAKALQAPGNALAAFDDWIGAVQKTAPEPQPAPVATVMPEQPITIARPERGSTNTAHTLSWFDEQMPALNKMAAESSPDAMSVQAGRAASDTEEQATIEALDRLVKQGLAKAEDPTNVVRVRGGTKPVGADPGTEMLPETKKLQMPKAAGMSAEVRNPEGMKNPLAVHEPKQLLPGADTDKDPRRHLKFESYDDPAQAWDDYADSAVGWGRAKERNFDFEDSRLHRPEGRQVSPLETPQVEARKMAMGAPLPTETLPPTGPQLRSVPREPIDLPPEQPREVVETAKAAQQAQKPWLTPGKTDAARGRLMQGAKDRLGKYAKDSMMRAGVDMMTVAGGALEEFVAGKMKPAAFAAQLADDPGLLLRLAKSGGKLGQAGQELVRAMNEGGANALKSRAFILSQQRWFKAELASQNQEEKSSASSR